VPAAGIGRRMGGMRKPYLPLAGQPILHHAIRALAAARGCAEIIPVLHPDDYDAGDVAAELAELFGIRKLARGGDQRSDSVVAGLQAVSPDVDIVLFHDGVRPLVDSELVERVAAAVRDHDAAIAAVPVVETVKDVAEGRRITGTPDRRRIWLARTPQGFRKDLISRAYEAARRDGFTGTDDAQLVERLGEDVYVVEDSHENIKITTPVDIAVAEAILGWRRSGRPAGCIDSSRAGGS
jgi:2-C-methyl-D-erythritol 4-phosphate cytidylyltransferase